jgi:hypothetical protein
VSEDTDVHVLDHPFATVTPCPESAVGIIPQISGHPQELPTIVRLGIDPGQVGGQPLRFREPTLLEAETGEASEHLKVVRTPIC